MKKSTRELLSLLKSAPSITNYLEEQKDDLISTEPLHVLLDELLAEKQLKKADIIKRSLLDRKYSYDIFRGAKKSPSRKKVLALCLAYPLSLDEAQRLLKSTGYPPLYARNEWDAVVIYALERGMNVGDVNEILSDMGEPLLEELE